jgi:hypothetical protein
MHSLVITHYMSTAISSLSLSEAAALKSTWSLVLIHNGSILGISMESYTLSCLTLEISDCRGFCLSHWCFTVIVLIISCFVLLVLFHCLLVYFVYYFQESFFYICRIKSTSFNKGNTYMNDINLWILPWWLAYFWASSVDTAHYCLRSHLLPTSKTTILYSACSLSSANHFSMSWNELYLEIS